MSKFLLKVCVNLLIAFYSPAERGCKPFSTYSIGLTLKTGSPMVWSQEGASYPLKYKSRINESLSLIKKRTGIMLDKPAVLEVGVEDLRFT